MTQLAIKTKCAVKRKQQLQKSALRLSISLALTLLLAGVLIFSIPRAYATAPITPDIITPTPGGTNVTEGEGTNADVFPFSILGDLMEDMSLTGATDTVELILLMTVLTLVPSILIMMTSFTRIVIILSFTRNAMGTQQMPPNQMIIGLALFLTYFTMYGTIQEINNNAWKPYNSGEITDVTVFFERAVTPLRNFMLNQIEIQDNADDLQTFMTLAELDMPQDPSQNNLIPTHVIIPAYITSEIKTAFKIGFLIFIPFIVIDMVVASALMSMGMMMLPPVMISLPFKIMLFVVVDGWNRVVWEIVKSFKLE